MDPYLYMTSPAPASYDTRLAKEVQVQEGMSIS